MKQRLSRRLIPPLLVIALSLAIAVMPAKLSAGDNVNQRQGRGAGHASQLKPIKRPKYKARKLYVPQLPASGRARHLRTSRDGVAVEGACPWRRRLRQLCDTFAAPATKVTIPDALLVRPGPRTHSAISAFGLPVFKDVPPIVYLENAARPSHPDKRPTEMRKLSGGGSE